MRVRLLAASVVPLVAVAVIGWWWLDQRAEESTVGRGIEVVQLNLCGALGCYGEGVPDRLEPVGYAASRISQARADLVLLNEVCFDQVDAIVERLQGRWAMAAVTVETLAAGNGCAGHGYGNAVLHRGTLVEERAFRSCEQSAEPCIENPPANLSVEQRAMICATVRLPDVDEAVVTACSVHLVPRGRHLLGDRTWSEWNDSQLRSLQHLVRWELDDGTAVVVGGDLNVGPRRALPGWPQGWTELDAERRPTRPAPEPRHKVDYVMFSPAFDIGRAELLAPAKCPSSRFPGHWCTDHLPLAGAAAIE